MAASCLGALSPFRPGEGSRTSLFSLKSPLRGPEKSGVFHDEGPLAQEPCGARDEI